jgi:NADH-quinone oxidoreductase subunit E
LSVRRLSLNQPASFAFKPATLKAAQGWMANFPPGRQQSACVPCLWLVQKQEGWVSEPAIRAVAQLLSMPVIRVLECATFYDVQPEPVGTRTLIRSATTPARPRRACWTPAAVIAPVNHTSADGNLTGRKSSAWAPRQRADGAINDYYYEDLTPEGFEKLIDDFAAGKKKAGFEIAARAPRPGERR